MTSTVKLSIDITSLRMFDKYVTGEIRVTDMLFSDISDRIIDHKDITRSVKKAIKLLGGFSTITITLTQGKQFTDYPEVKTSYRFCDGYSGLTMAKLDNNKYENWDEVILGTLFVKIKEAAILGTKLHQEAVRKQAEEIQ